VKTLEEAMPRTTTRRRSVRRRATLTSLVRLAGPPFLVFLGGMGIWYGMTYLVLAPERRFLLPPLHAVVREGFLVSGTRAELFKGLLVSAKVAFIGLGVAFAIGIVVAILMSQAKWIERSLYPWAVFLQTVPILALVPLLGFWFGFGLMSRVIVCVIISLFPIIINTLNGLLGADRRLHDLLTLHNASRWTRLAKLQMPAALPDVFIGLRTSAGLSVIGAIVGDFFFGRGEKGLGLLLVQYSRRLESEELLATVIVACGFGVLVFTLFGVLGRRVVGAWSESWGEQGPAEEAVQIDVEPAVAGGGGGTEERSGSGRPGEGGIR
jgi:NitT/TauT family transport system permease protein